MDFGWKDTPPYMFGEENEIKIGLIKDPIERFFAYARERQSIYLKKEAGLPFPWTDDPILQHFKITNVFREQDRTTKFVKKFVRDPLKSVNTVLFANLFARWFNRIEVMQIIFCEPDLWHKTLFDNYLEYGVIDIVERQIRNQIPKGPYCTGAYLITSPKGFDKLEGVCINIDNFHRNLFPWRGKLKHWSDVGEFLLQNRGQITLEEVWEYLKQVPFQGTFHSHENVIDLRYTDLLDFAPDKNTWTNPGPGCLRGLATIHGRNITESIPRKQAIRELIELLGYSHDSNLWPKNWQPWELHQCEMWCCEFYKLEKVFAGGKTRSIYKHK